MSPKLIIMLLIIGGGALWYALDSQLGLAPSMQQTNVHAEQVPSFRVTSLSADATLEIEALRGRYVLLNVWASWCTPCVAEFPDLIELAHTYPDQLSIVAISIDRKAHAAEEFLAKIDTPTLPNLFIAHDPKREVTEKLFHTYKYPETIVVDPQGKMVLKVAGILRPEDLEKIKALLD